MKSSNLLIFSFIVLLLAQVGCSKKPEKIHNPIIDVESKIENKKEIFNFTLKGAIHNKNSATVFKNFKASVVLKDKQAILLSLPFSVPVVLPFSTENNVLIKKTLKENELLPFLNSLGINKDEAIKGIKHKPIKDKSVALKIISYETADILKVLRKKMKVTKNTPSKKDNTNTKSNSKKDNKNNDTKKKGK